MKREESVYIPVRVSAQIAAMVERIATAQGVPKSKVLRDLLTAGLQAKGYIDGGENMADLVQKTLEASLKPQVERLASISAKAAHISAANFFMNYATLRQFISDEDLPEFDELATRARKLGAEYLKLSRDRNIDQFLSRGLAAMARDDENT